MAKKKALRKVKNRAALLEAKLWESIVMGSTFAELLGEEWNVRGEEIIAAYHVGQVGEEGTRVHFFTPKERT